MPEPLRIAIVAPLAVPVSPESDSSIEKLVSLLADDLVARGHEVTLFATGDSRTAARLSAIYPRGYKADERLWTNWQFHELLHLGSAFVHAAEFDVIHSHVYHFAPPFACLVRTPVLHTDHVPTSRDVRDAYARYPDARLVAVSRYHRRQLAAVRQVDVVYNGIDTGSFPFSPTRGRYLAFLGHLIPRKGAADAIAVAASIGMPLLLAGKADEDYFREKIAPHVDGHRVQYLGPLGIAERNALLAGAGALLFTSSFAEPFGLVMAEAMACGTPVAALDRCAVREVVEPGVTGHYADCVDSLAAQLPAVLELDRPRVREAVRRRFDFRRMVDDYEAVYRRVLRAHAGPAAMCAAGGTAGT